MGVIAGGVALTASMAVPRAGLQKRAHAWLPHAGSRYLPRCATSLGVSPHLNGGLPLTERTTAALRPAAATTLSSIYPSMHSAIIGSLWC